MKMNRYIGIITLLKIFAVIAGIYLFYYWDVVFNPDISPYEHSYNFCIKKYNTEYKGIVVKNWLGTRGVYSTKLLNGTIYHWYCSDNVHKFIYLQDSLVEWELINVGDSIYKPSGTFNVYLYKQANPDSVILLKCDYDCETILKGQVEASELKIKSVTRYKKNKALKKLTLKWKFNKKLEKYINGFCITKETLDEIPDTSALLRPETREYTDSLFPDISGERNIFFEYKLIVKVKGLKDRISHPGVIVPLYKQK